MIIPQDQIGWFPAHKADTPTVQDCVVKILGKHEEKR